MFSIARTKFVSYICPKETKETILEQFREKIEQYGVVMEKMGLGPVAARIFVYLLIAPEHQATFEDLVDYFKVSKSAVSNALKMLSSSNMVGAKTIGGQRKRYFSIDFECMLSVEQNLAKFKIFYNMLDDIRSIRGIDDGFANELKNVSSLYKMLLVEFPIIIDRWKRTIDLENKK